MSTQDDSDTRVASEEGKTDNGDHERQTVEYEFELSVLVCTIPSRVSTFLPNIIKQLNEQSRGKPVQVLYLGDNRRMSTGKKRNLLVSIAEGKYLCFVDDDDTLSDDYVDSILQAAKTDADCLLFDSLISLNGCPPKMTSFSLKNQHLDLPTRYERKPAHIHPIKTHLAKATQFPDISAGEDYIWQTAVVPFLKTEHQIGKVLYHYNWNYLTSAALGLDKT